MEYHILFSQRNGVKTISYIFPRQIIINCRENETVESTYDANKLEDAAIFLAEHRGQLAKDGFLKTGLIDKESLRDLQFAAIIGGRCLEGILRDLRARVEEEGEALLTP